MSTSSFYKYSPVYQDKTLDKEYSIVNLLNDQVTFSTRKNFNDLFDSKVNLIKPTRKELKELSRQLKTSKRTAFKNAFFGDDWELNIKKFEKSVDKLFDDYLYFCVTNKNDNIGIIIKKEQCFNREDSKIRNSTGLCQTYLFVFSRRNCSISEPSLKHNKF